MHCNLLASNSWFVVFQITKSSKGSSDQEGQDGCRCLFASLQLGMDLPQSIATSANTANSSHILFVGPFGGNPTNHGANLVAQRLPGQQDTALQMDRNDQIHLVQDGKMGMHGFSMTLQESGNGGTHATRKDIIHGDLVAWRRKVLALETDSHASSKSLHFCHVLLLNVLTDFSSSLCSLAGQSGESCFNAGQPGALQMVVAVSFSSRPLVSAADR
jgi:hypothetical protein